MTPNAAGLDLRPYVPGDEHAILALFHQVFGRPLPRAFWQRVYASNPLGEIFVELAWDGDVLAGHYGVCPMLLSVDGHELRTARSMTTMTHPNYRGRGLFPLLAERLYDRLRAASYEAVWGFPNINSHRGIVRDIGWRDIYQIPTLTLRLSDARLGTATANPLVPLRADDPQLDAMWARRTRDGVMVVRDRRYLSWRGSPDIHPEYRLFGRFDAGALCAYALVKPFEDAFDVVDFGCAGSDEAGLARALFSGIVEHAREAGAHRLLTWAPVSSHIHRVLEAMGFQPGAPVTYFAGRRLGDSPYVERLFDPHAWWWTMSDSDIY